ncbi:MAG: hypothetical protein RBR14_04795, partial [Candidatus Cloacimonas acidaminovorans]|nr:hypothetical protein [Candidatus Cloacimonas acidaminovorans]
NSYRNNRGRNNQNPEQIFQSELNTDKPIPLIPPIIVDNYMHLLGKDIKGGYFLPLPPKFSAQAPFFTTVSYKLLRFSILPFILIDFLSC